MSFFAIVNNDSYRELNGNKMFQKEKEPMIIVSNKKAVDRTSIFISKNCICTYSKIIAKSFGAEFKLTFGKNHHQNSETISERAVYMEIGIELLYENLGG